MDDGRSATVVLVLGVSQRSGTHYLHDLLASHPDCVSARRSLSAAGASWEDLLLEQAPLLGEYATRTRRRWDARWRDDLAAEDRLLECLGDGLLAFLRDVEPEPSSPERPNHVVSKSPTVAGLHLVPRLLPGTPILLLVRDGRDVVDSALRSFGGSAERWMRVWRAGARAILDFEAADRTGQGLVVRYEDLVSDTLAELKRILTHVGLDLGRLDVERSTALPIRGSSRGGRDEQGALHWFPTDPTDPSGPFDPVGHGRGLSLTRRRRMEWLAGVELEALGYPVDGDVGRPGGQRAQDLLWGVGRSGRRVLDAARSTVG